MQVPSSATSVRTAPRADREVDPMGEGGAGAYALPPPALGTTCVPAKLPDVAEVLRHARMPPTPSAKTPAGPQHAGPPQAGTESCAMQTEDADWDSMVAEFDQVMATHPDQFPAARAAWARGERHVRMLLTSPTQSPARTPHYAGASRAGTGPTTPDRAAGTRPRATDAGANALRSPPATPPREPGPTNEPATLESQMAELEEQAKQIENQMADATAAHKRLLDEARKAEREGESPPAAGIKPGPRSAPLQQEGDGTAAHMCAPRHATAVAFERRVDDLRLAEIAYEACHGTYAEQQSWSEDQHSLLEGARSELERAMDRAIWNAPSGMCIYVEALLELEEWDPETQSDWQSRQSTDDALEVKMKDYFESDRRERILQAKRDYDRARDQMRYDHSDVLLLVKPRADEEPRMVLQPEAKQPKTEPQPETQEEPGAEQQPKAETQPKPEPQPGAMEEPGAEQQRRAAGVNSRSGHPGQAVGMDSRSGQPGRAAETGSQGGQPERAAEAGSRGAPEGRFWSASESDSEEEGWDEDPPPEPAAKPAQPAQMSADGEAAAEPAQPAQMSADGEAAAEPAQPAQMSADEEAAAEPAQPAQMWSQDQLRARWEAGPPIEPAELVRDSGKQVWLASESDSEEEDDTVDLPAVDCGPFQPWAHRQAGELLVVGDNGGQWQWQTVTESDDEEVVAATKAQPAETWELAEPAVAEPTEPAQMSADDRMGGPNGPDAGHWPTARHPLPLQGRGGAEWSLDATKLEKLWNGGWTTFVPTWKTPEGVRTW